MKKNGQPKVIVVMPAYNAEKTLEKTYRDIPKEVVDKILVVDDDSHDRTVEIGKNLGLTVFVHPKNLGYGGNQKTCYTQALKAGGDIIVMVHPDYQYDATLIPELIAPITGGRVDIMLGSRIRTRKEALAGGMPSYKYFGNRLLTLLENLVLGLNLSEYHTGFRAYKREVLASLPFAKFSNDFVFDQQILMAAHQAGFRIGEIAVPVRYFPEASSINFWRSLRYGVMILLSLLLYVFGSKGAKSEKN